ncbi:unnamed protein product [Citrullus colocynthis]|uniref:Uncharacterized protein n=1 Tax=Citrullus colocynthis TaxID=252529 RepID=A0ABP0YLT7_9ROSI
MMIMKRWNGFCYAVSPQDDDYLELGTPEIEDRTYKLQRGPSQFPCRRPPRYGNSLPVPLAPFRINVGSFTRIIARVLHVLGTKYLDTINIHQNGALFVRAIAIFLSSEATKTCAY